MRFLLITGAGLLKLHDDIETCGYEDVKVMWEMLRRSESEVVGHQPKRKQRPFWRVSVWSNGHAPAASSYTATHAWGSHQHSPDRSNNLAYSPYPLFSKANRPNAYNGTGLSCQTCSKIVKSLVQAVHACLPLWAKKKPKKRKNEKHPFVSNNKNFGSKLRIVDVSFFFRRIEVTNGWISVFVNLWDHL